MGHDADGKPSVSQTHPRIGKLVWTWTKIKAFFLWVMEHVVLFFFEELFRVLTYGLHALFWVLARILIYPCYLLARLGELFAPKRPKLQGACSSTCADVSC